jgi:hypothetical protein
LIVPAIASIALGGALLVPIRDDRNGRKATRLGRTPVKPDFRILVDATPSSQETLFDSKLEDGRETEGQSHREATERAREIVRTLGAASDDCEIIAAASETPRKHQAFAAFRNVVGKLRSKASSAIATREVAEAPERSCDDEIVIERSFAQELAALLSQTSPVIGSIHETPEPAETIAWSDSETVSVERPEHARLESSSTTVSTESNNVQAPTSREDEADAAPPIAIASAPRAYTDFERPERAVPLTRLPLRHAPDAITWPSSATPPLVFPGEAERYAFLRSAAQSRTVEGDALMARAYREETPVGRTLALEALSRNAASRSALETFVFALATGSDQERAISVDALADAGARAEVARGLSDRVDAIAAKAALAYVGTTEREDYHAALAPLIDEARIAAILDMLAGVIG